MTYRTDDYNKIDRNYTRARAILNWIDRARDFGLLKYTDSATISATTRDGQRIEIHLSDNLKKAIVMAGTEHCVNAAKTMGMERTEEVDFEKAAKV